MDLSLFVQCSLHFSVVFLFHSFVGSHCMYIAMYFKNHLGPYILSWRILNLQMTHHGVMSGMRFFSWSGFFTRVFWISCHTPTLSLHLLLILHHWAVVLCHKQTLLIFLEFRIFKTIVNHDLNSESIDGFWGPFLDF